jgi:hypothetical protein
VLFSGKNGKIKEILREYKFKCICSKSEVFVQSACYKLLILLKYSYIVHYPRISLRFTIFSCNVCSILL